MYETIIVGRRPTGRTAAAYHEAGHAVAALAYRLPVVEARLQGDGGEVRFDQAAATQRQLAVVTAAGPVAELRRCGGIDLHGAWGRGGRGSDRRLLDAAADRLAGRLDAAARQHLLDGIASAAHRLLGDHWPAVTAVARALLRRGRLSGAALRRVVRGA